MSGHPSNKFSITSHPDSKLMQTLRVLCLLAFFVSLLVVFSFGASKNVALATGVASYDFDMKWGSRGSGDGQFMSPSGIAIDPSQSYIFVTDSQNNRIQKFTLNGIYMSKWGSLGQGSGQFDNPTGIAAAPSGDVFISDLYNQRVQKFTADGLYITQWGSSGSDSGQFQNPSGIAVDSSGDVYVVDQYNYRIQKFTSEGSYITQWGTEGSADGQFLMPEGIAVDSLGYVYVTDVNMHRVQKFTSTGIYIAKWGSFGAGNGQFNLLNSIAVDASGDIFVSDSDYNDRIQKFTSTGIYITQWGSFGGGNGQLNYPYGLAIATSGDVFVADAYNNRIQKFVPSGSSSTTKTRYEETDGNISYSASCWNNYNNAALSGGAAKISKKKSCTATFSYTGSKVEFISAKAKQLGKAKIYIDNVYQSTLDLYSSTTLAQQMVYSKTHPSSGAHTIKVEVLATKNTRATGYFVPIDAFDVTN